MAGYANIDSTWQELKPLYATIDGVQTPLQKGYANVDGVWCPFYSAIPDLSNFLNDDVFTFSAGNNYTPTTERTETSIQASGYRVQSGAPAFVNLQTREPILPGGISTISVNYSVSSRSGDSDYSYLMRLRILNTAMDEALVSDFYSAPSVGQSGSGTLSVDMSTVTEPFIIDLYAEIRRREQSVGSGKNYLTFYAPIVVTQGG